MGYGTNGLTFNTLREGNKARIPEFKNKHGVLAHTTLDGSDWSPSQWLQALTGEIGEYANKRKKFERGDITLEEFKIEAESELADIQTYLDILARRCLDTPGNAHRTGVDLGQATMNKFNLVSIRVGSTVRINSYDWYRFSDDLHKSKIKLNDNEEST